MWGSTRGGRAVTQIEHTSKVMHPTGACWDVTAACCTVKLPVRHLCYRTSDCPLVYVKCVQWNSEQVWRSDLTCGWRHRVIHLRQVSAPTHWLVCVSVLCVLLSLTGLNYGPNRPGRTCCSVHAPVVCRFCLTAAVLSSAVVKLQHSSAHNQERCCMYLIRSLLDE